MAFDKGAKNEAAKGVLRELMAEMSSATMRGAKKKKAAKKMPMKGPPKKMPMSDPSEPDADD